MTHRGPFQPLPFCDSVILFEGRPDSLYQKGEIVPWCISVGYMFVNICIPRLSKRGTNLANLSVKLNQQTI